MVNKLIRTIFLLITLVLLSVSVYYSRGWHVFVQMPGLIAWGLSGAFVISATALFDLAIGKFRDRNKTNILIGFFYLSIWVILTLYSMYSTLAGQFNVMLKTSVSTYDVSSDQEEIDRLQSQIDKPTGIIDPGVKKILISDIDNKITAFMEEKKIINNMISDTSGAEEAALYRSAIRDANTRLGLIENSMEILSAEKRELLLPEIIDTSDIEIELRELKKQRDSNLTDAEKLSLQPDIFDFLSEIFETTADMIQFIALAFPSILVDLISPIFSALFIYGLGDKRKTYSDGYSDGTGEAFSVIDAELEKRLGK